MIALDSIPSASMYLLVALLSLSAYFAALETSITNANKIRLKHRAENGDLKAKRALKLLNEFERSISTILIGNNIVNIAIAIIATTLATEMFGNDFGTIALTVVIVTVIILIFGEIIPKSIAKLKAEKFLLAFSASLLALMKLFYPISWPFVKLQLGVNKQIRMRNEEPTVTEEDVKALVDIGEEEGTFLSDEKELLHNAIEFDDILVKEILVPRLDVVAIDISSSIEEVKQLFMKEKYTRIPVYDGTIDNVVGIISHRDFFEKYIQDLTFEIKDILRKPFFTVTSMKISSLLKEMQKRKIQLAIVLDEYGGTAGIVTIEDIIEEIVGDIWDEYDDNEVLYETIDETKIRLHGMMPLEDFCELVNIDMPQTSSNTLSGWISDILGYLPQKGEMVSFLNLNFYIEEVKNRRIEKVIVEINKETVQTA